MNAGAQQLAAIFDRPLQDTVAADVATSPATITKLKNGSLKPGRDLALRIERILGIPVAAWDEPIQKKFSRR
jgi:DNA-binding XRE family transcriptional regulator